MWPCLGAGVPAALGRPTTHTGEGSELPPWGFPAVPESTPYRPREVLAVEHQEALLSDGPRSLWFSRARARARGAGRPCQPHAGTLTAQEGGREAQSCSAFLSVPAPLPPLPCFTKIKELLKAQSTQVISRMQTPCLEKSEYLILRREENCEQEPQGRRGGRREAGMTAIRAQRHGPTQDSGPTAQCSPQMPWAACVCGPGILPCRGDSGGL